MSRNLFVFAICWQFLCIVRGLDNGLATTPPMGWLSWIKFLCQTDCVHHPFTCISQQLYMDMADKLVSDGYREVGYKSVHIDDCWMERQRDAQGTLVADLHRFPNGIKTLAKYMHDRGLELGIYADYGNYTCQCYPGSFYHLKQDADTFAQWDVDYLKMDGCNVNKSYMAKAYLGYPEMGMWLNKTGRPMVYSCSWPSALLDTKYVVNYTIIGKTCNLWRNYHDIQITWESVMDIVNYYDHHQDTLIPAHGPGHWNDPDMIIVGNNEITPDQSRAQMSIWSIWSAPLLMSNDLRLVAPVYKEILQNTKVIAIDQDPMGVMGRLVANTTSIGVYVKPVTPADSKLALYSYAVVIFNRNAHYSKTVTIRLSDIGLKSSNGYLVEELWTGQKFGLMQPQDDYTATVPPTGVSMIKATLAQMVQQEKSVQQCFSGFF